MYHPCNVTDEEQLARTLDAVHRADGPIAGILHSRASSAASPPWNRCSFRGSRHLLAVKIDAALNLLRLTQNDPVNWFLGLSSVVGRFGGPGRSDYALANDMLAKLAAWIRAGRPGCRALTIHWNPWADTGMMASSRAALFRLFPKTPSMSPDEGCRHFAAELAAGAPECEVLISNAAAIEAFTPPAARPIAALTAASPAAAAAAPHEAEGFALVDKLIERMPRPQRRRRCAVRPRRRSVPQPAPASRQADPADRDRRRGLRRVGPRGRRRRPAGRRPAQRRGDRWPAFPDSTPLDVRLHADVTSTSVACRLTSDLFNRAGQLILPNRLHASGVVDLAAEAEPLTAPPPGEPARWYDIFYPDSDAPIYHGPVFRCIRRTAIDAAGGWATLVAPEPNDIVGRRCGRTLVVPATVLDACFFACGICLWVADNTAIGIPRGFRRLRLARLPHYLEHCVVRLLHADKEHGLGVFDFTVFGEDQAVILQVEGYRTSITRGAGI